MAFLSISGSSLRHFSFSRSLLRTSNFLIYLSFSLSEVSIWPWLSFMLLRWPLRLSRSEVISSELRLSLIY